MRLLVVGGDSLIGNALLRHARALAWDVTATSRRPQAADMMALDLMDAATPAALLARDWDAVVLCAALSRHDQCATDPAAAHRINVESPVRLALQLAEEGTHVVFLSSDSVFGESNCLRREADAVAPGNRAYPALKAQAEALLQDALPADQLAIVRLTKVVSAGREPFGAWCAALRSGGRIEGLSDLLFSPVSLRHAAQSLLQIAAGGHHGVLHLSGERDLSYAEFAWELSARAGGISPVAARSMAEAGVQPSYRPTHSCLDMRHTSELTGLRPQPATAVVEDLLEEAHLLRTGAPAPIVSDALEEGGECVA